MATFDAKKEFKEFYNPSTKHFSFVDVPPMNFLMLDGGGDPNTSPAYAATLETLYALAYTIKFALKPEGFEYVVPPLEGLWWAHDMSAFDLSDKNSWLWTMMIMQPAAVTSNVVEEAKIVAARKKPLPLLNQVRLETFHEGKAAQIMYIGAYADEGPTIARMHAFIHESGYALAGKHHEIYLSDPRRTPAEKLKTIIRQPIR